MKESRMHLLLLLVLLLFAVSALGVDKVYATNSYPDDSPLTYIHPTALLTFKDNEEVEQKILADLAERDERILNINSYDVMDYVLYASLKDGLIESFTFIFMPNIKTDYTFNLNSPFSAEDGRYPYFRVAGDFPGNEEWQDPSGYKYDVEGNYLGRIEYASTTTDTMIKLAADTIDKEGNLIAAQDLDTDMLIYTNQADSTGARSHDWVALEDGQFTPGFDEEKGFFAGFWDNMLQFLKDIFIPKEGYFKGLFDKSMALYEKKFGFLYETIDIGVGMMDALIVGKGETKIHLGKFFGGDAYIDFTVVEKNLPTLFNMFVWVLRGSTVFLLISSLYAKLMELLRG